jgi:hypothetical protein
MSQGRRDAAAECRSCAPAEEPVTRVRTRRTQDKSVGEQYVLDFACHLDDGLTAVDEDTCVDKQPVPLDGHGCRA